MVYCWMKGVCEIMIHNLFHIFVVNSWTMYFITNVNYVNHEAFLKKKYCNLVLLRGNFVYSNNTMGNVQ